MKTDRRWQILMFVVLASVTGGALVYLMPERARTVAAPEAVSAVASLSAPAAETYSGELHERFQQAAAMLHIGQHLYALEALERVLELAPHLPEARVNAGYALLGLDRPGRAREQFEHAIAIRPNQVNAYYGLALALEALGDLEGALGAMRSYVHLAEQGDAHVRRAQSAIWEWEDARERGAGSADQHGARESAGDDTVRS